MVLIQARIDGKSIIKPALNLKYTIFFIEVI